MAKINVDMELKDLEYFKSLYEQNILLRKAFNMAIRENCYYHEDECSVCTLGMLGQCEIMNAINLLKDNGVKV
jgi:hypothetical protein